MAATLGRADAYPLENYKRGTRVWLRDNEHVWLRAELLEDLKFTSNFIKLKREIDDEILDEPFNPDSLPFLANPEILIGKDDLTNMSYLHEPAGKLQMFIGVLTVVVFSPPQSPIPIRKEESNLHVLWNCLGCH